MLVGMLLAKIRLDLLLINAIFQAKLFPCLFTGPRGICGTGILPLVKHAFTSCKYLDFSAVNFKHNFPLSFGMVCNQISFIIAFSAVSI